MNIKEFINPVSCDMVLDCLRYSFEHQLMAQVKDIIKGTYKYEQTKGKNDMPIRFRSLPY